MELTREMIEEILDKARSYVMSEKEEYFRSQVEQMISSEDYDSLYDAFYTSLAFGTAGMRGVIGGGTNRINTFMVRKVTQGLADYCNSYSDSSSVVIAYDSRNWSKEFALSAALVLSANGVRTYLYDTLHPVPMLSFALRHLGTTAGIVITASHNPSKYNGYKVYWSDGGQVTPPHDIEIAKLANAVSASDIKDIDEAEARKSGILSGVPDSVDEAYYSMVISSLRRPQVVKGSPITVAYTPLHGSGNVPVREMLSRLGIRTEVVKEQELPDGNFPTVRLPNPESAEAMTKVIELAKAVKADIVLGTDPDADRMGLAIPTDSGKTDYLLLTGNQIASLLADYLLCTNREQGGRDRKPLCPEKSEFFRKKIISSADSGLLRRKNLDDISAAVKYRVGARRAAADSRKGKSVPSENLPYERFKGVRILKNLSPVLQIMDHMMKKHLSLHADGPPFRPVSLRSFQGSLVAHDHGIAAFLIPPLFQTGIRCRSAGAAAAGYRLKLRIRQLALFFLLLLQEGVHFLRLRFAAVLL